MEKARPSSAIRAGILLIAYHFPPINMSSGIQRTLRFAQYLPKFGWDPMVLAPHPRAYRVVSSDYMTDILGNIPVRRAFALDTARHLAIGGRYLRLMATPDAWITWWLGAVPAGLTMIREHGPRAIWSTSPVPTAHLIGMTLHRLTGLPWVADFRDPMAQPDAGYDPVTRWVSERIERATVRRAAAVTVTTMNTLKLYQSRYPEHAGKFHLIENGYDEEAFSQAEAQAGAPATGARPFILLHSGVVYPHERDPRDLLRAIGDMKRQGVLQPGGFCLRFRAPTDEEWLQTQIDQAGVADLVEIAPPVPYRAALQEMLEADGLLILQSGNCNDQVPAKLYEYMRSRKPVLSLTDDAGDTAATLRRVGMGLIAPLDNAARIAEILPDFIARAKAGQVPIPPDAEIAAASRRGRTADFARILDSAIAAPGLRTQSHPA